MLILCFVTSTQRYRRFELSLRLQIVAGADESHISVLRCWKSRGKIFLENKNKLSSLTVVELKSLNLTTRSYLNRFAIQLC